MIGPRLRVVGEGRRTPWWRRLQREHVLVLSWLGIVVAIVTYITLAQPRMPSTIVIIALIWLAARVLPALLHPTAPPPPPSQVIEHRHVHRRAGWW